MSAGDGCACRVGEAMTYALVFMLGMIAGLAIWNVPSNWWKR